MPTLKPNAGVPWAFADMLLEHGRDNGLGMDVKETVCSWNTQDIMDRMLLQHEGDYGLGMDVKVTVCSWNKGLGMDAMVTALRTRRQFWFGHECNGNRMLLEHGRDNGLGMDVKETVCSWKHAGYYGPYALAARRRLWFGHGCKGNRMLLEHEGD